MKKFPFVVWAAALGVMVVVGCKKSPPEEPAAPAEAAATEADEPSAEPAAVEAAAAPDPDARVLEGISLPVGWTEVKAKSPRGVGISMGVPGGWVELKPPNASTLLVRGARYERETDGGLKATAVAVDFEGDTAALAEQTRTRLVPFATIEREGPVRVGSIDGHEFVARWSTAVGEKETKQMIVATGKEAIGINCEMPPGKLAELEGLCDEIFATVRLETP